MVISSRRVVMFSGQVNTPNAERMVPSSVSCFRSVLPVIFIVAPAFKSDNRIKSVCLWADGLLISMDCDWSIR